jgi:hypothetical protein
MTRDKLVLGYQLWGDDDSDYHVLSNRMLVTRTLHECAICFESIPIGTRVRAQSEAYDGKAMTFRICTLCCEAMVKARRYDSDDGLAMEERTALGMKNARSAVLEGGEP